MTESAPTTIKLEAKQLFPEFALPDQTGKIHHSSDYLGKYLVVYVYPKDDTPGCTKEACDFRDALELRALGAAILGVSADDATSHQEFSEKYSLPFPLLSDLSLEALKSWGAYGSKNRFGTITEGIKRVTFVIDPHGKVVKAWYAVKVEGHVEMVTKAIREDQK